jgi:hypothetical protein
MLAAAATIAYRYQVQPEPREAAAASKQASSLAACTDLHKTACLEQQEATVAVPHLLG